MKRPPTKPAPGIERYTVETDAGPQMYEVEEIPDPRRELFLTPRYHWRKVVGSGLAPAPWSRSYSARAAAIGGAIRTLKIAGRSSDSK
jgi:hypothetical protein